MDIGEEGGEFRQLGFPLNEQTNRIEFGHDPAADWARFQFLKQFARDTPRWTALAENPLSTNALRIVAAKATADSGIIALVHKTASGFQDAGLVDKATAGELDALYLTPSSP